LRDYTEYAERLQEACDVRNEEQDRKEETEYLHSLGVRLTEGVFWSLKSARLANGAAPEILHTVYLGVLQHLMKWIMSFLKEHKRMERFDDIWAAVPSYPGLLKFNKTYGAVSQWTGKEMRALGRFLLPVFSATLLNPTTTEKPTFGKAIACVKGIIYFHLMAQYRSHTDATLKYMEDYLDDFHQNKEVFSQYRAGKVAKRTAETLRKELGKALEAKRTSGEEWKELSNVQKRRVVNEEKIWIKSRVKSCLEEHSDFNFIKLHLLAHFSDYVKELGHLSNVSAELSESMHCELKESFRRSNKNNASSQILLNISRLDGFQHRELNVEAAKRRSHEPNKQRQPLPRSMKSPQNDVKHLKDLANWCGLAGDELQTLIAWCLKTWFERPAYFDTDDDFGQLGDFRYTRYNAVSIPVTCFQTEDEQQTQIIRSTGKSAWRKCKPPRNDTVLLWTGKNSESHFASSRGRIPGRVDCLFTMSDSIHDNSSYHLALVTTFVPGPMRQPEGMIIVEEREMRPWQGGTRRRAPHTGIGSRYIVPVKAIQGAAHLVPIEPGCGNTRWYLNNTVDLEIFNLIY
jgi:hypothetical protein